MLFKLNAQNADSLSLFLAPTGALSGAQSMLIGEVAHQRAFSSESMLIRECVHQSSESVLNEWSSGATIKSS